MDPYPQRIGGIHIPLLVHFHPIRHTIPVVGQVGKSPAIVHRAIRRNIERPDVLMV